MLKQERAGWFAFKLDSEDGGDGGDGAPASAAAMKVEHKAGECSRRALYCHIPYVTAHIDMFPM